MKINLRIILVTFLNVTSIYAESNQDKSSNGNYTYSDIRYVVFFEGKCNLATINSADITKDCRETASNSSYKNGTVAFLFFINGNLISFIGSNDEHPNNDSYILHVNAINLTNNPTDTKKPLGLGNLDAVGTCNVEGDLSKKAYVACSAIVIGTKDVFKINFQSQKVLNVFN